jgi:predicted nucleic acid binding AN1-type Zn finger protein
VKEKAMTQNSIPLKMLHLLKLSSSLEREKNGEKLLIKVKPNGLFKSYKSSATLNSSCYHIQKRNKTSNE